MALTTVEQVRVLVDEASAVFYTDSKVLREINSGLLKVWGALSPTSTSTQWVVNSNTDLVARPTLYAVEHILGTKGELKVGEQSRLDYEYPLWRQEPASYPTHIVKFDTDYYRVWPQARVTSTLTALGVPWPTEVTSGSPSVTSINPYAEGAVVYHAAARLLLLSAPQASQEYFKRSKKALLDAKKYQRNKTFNNTLTLSPEGPARLGGDFVNGPI